MAQMRAAPELQAADDQTLIARIAEGDRDALTELYRRYFGRLHDFVQRTVRSPQRADDVTQTAFLRAWDAIRRGQRPEHVKAWLFTIARNAAIDDLRVSRRLVSDEARQEAVDDDRYAQVDESRLHDPELQAHAGGLTALVWEAAAALKPHDYALLDMHMRQDLDADEIADALQISRGAVYTRLTRLRQAMDERVRAVLLGRRGDCGDLRELLAALPADTAASVRNERVRAHMRTCPDCSRQAAAMVQPSAIFAGIATVAVAGLTAEAILAGILGGAGFGSGAAGGGGATVFTRLQQAATAGPQQVAVAAVVAAAAVAGLVVGVLAVTGGSSEPPVVTAQAAAEAMEEDEPAFVSAEPEPTEPAPVAPSLSVDVVNHFGQAQESVVQFGIQISGQGGYDRIRIEYAGPEGATIFSAMIPGGRCTLGGQDAVCELADVAPGTSLMLAIRLSWAAPPAGEHVLTVSAGEPGGELIVVGTARIEARPVEKPAPPVAVSAGPPEEDASEPPAAEPTTASPPATTTPVIDEPQTEPQSEPEPEPEAEEEQEDEPEAAGTVEPPLIQLQVGLNLIAYRGPVRPISFAFPPHVNAAITAVIRVDPADQGAWFRWAMEGPDSVNRIVVLKPGEVYLLLVSQAISWQHPSVVFERDSAQLAPGWNVVIYQGDTLPLGPALADAVDAVQEIYTLDAGAQTWQSWVRGGAGTTLTSVESGKAYLVLASGAATWSFPVSGT